MSNDGFNPSDGVAAGGILKEAANIVEGQRQTTHGPKERSFAVIAQFWMIYLAGRRGRAGCYINAQDVAAMMALLKVSRSIQGTATRDHYVDLAGYGAIAGEIGLSGDAAQAGAHDALADAILASNTDLGIGKRLADAEAEVRRLTMLVTDGEKRLDLAAQLFDSYALHHHQKSPPDAIKAQRNAEMAVLCKGGAAMGMPQRPGRVSEAPKRDVLVQPFTFTGAPLPPGVTAVSLGAAPAAIHNTIAYAIGEPGTPGWVG